MIQLLISLLNSHQNHHRIIIKPHSKAKINNNLKMNKLFHWTNKNNPKNLQSKNKHKRIINHHQKMPMKIMEFWHRNNKYKTKIAKNKVKKYKAKINNNNRIKILNKFVMISNKIKTQTINTCKHKIKRDKNRETLKI